MDMPSYYKLHADLWRGVNDALPPAQAAKVLYALEALFFDGVEVDTEKLPKAARKKSPRKMSSGRKYENSSAKHNRLKWRR